MIYGNVDGVKKYALDRLKKIYDMQVPKDVLCSREIVGIIWNFSIYLNREISVAVNRRGEVVNVTIGNSSTVDIGKFTSLENRLSGIRIIHTHPGSRARLSMVDVSALTKLKLDCIAAVGIKNGVIELCMGFCKIEDKLIKAEISNEITLDEGLQYNILDKIYGVEETLKLKDISEEKGERAVLVGTDNRESLNELEELARACNAETLEKVFQKRDTIDAAFYIGKGKVKEIGMICQIENANLVIFDDELSGSQIRNLEENLGVKVIDRTVLILDIFATRAKSRESKMQVELAQLEYRFARLSGLGTVLSRTGGGIGTRGPGEKKLETDRRHIREKIYEIKSELKKAGKVRDIQRRRRNGTCKISLVGYTNSGKSTLRNMLCEIAAPGEIASKGKAFEADMLFATLDTTTRAVELKDGRIVTVTDTVGFINKLPHDLIESFKSTLEEINYSDLILHVVDVSSSRVEKQMEVVNKVLKELSLGEKPVLVVLNKVDKVDKDRVKAIMSECRSLDVVCVSAKYGINLEELLEKISDLLPTSIKKVQCLIPYTKQSLVSFIHNNCKIEKEKYGERGTYITALVDEKCYDKIKEFVVRQ
ncbi:MULTISPECIES: GTPase HflX [Clostridium]|uniref:GTPase HflX n=1 Tax=Clostridium lapidicellarium TaxID=3240931 RepID=A0ABV4DW83_9CLOT|nr:GTPase HflX [Clostridiales bacterium]